nr:7,8-didemethyl-8-hydroxy-5-deazariboflavin synthase subunit CofG [Synechococcus sp. GFB01]
MLLLSGEVAPGAPGRAAWFGRLLRLSHLALEAGRLPHTNAGPLSRREMAALGRRNPSMGLMLEGLGPAVDARHRHAPSKTLEQRLIQIEQAGRLGIPFTTGLLLGLGESAAERREALELLALLQRHWGHIQEVILQPWRPGGAAAGPLAAHEVDDLLGLIAVARQVLPEEVHLQLPPNLWPPDRLIEALEAGIDDLGGLDLQDVINPAYPQPGTGALAERLAAAGWRLLPRCACTASGWPACRGGCSGRRRRCPSGWGWIVSVRSGVEREISRERSPRAAGAPALQPDLPDRAGVSGRSSAQAVSGAAAADPRSRSGAAAGCGSGPAG